MNCRLRSGFAEISLPSGDALLGPGGADSLLAALEQCATVHAIFFEALPEPADGRREPEAEQKPTGEAAVVEGAEEQGSTSASSVHIDAVIAKLGQLPQLLIGFASGPVGLAESCIFAGCDVLFASPSTTFQLLHRDASAPVSALAVAPLAVLRRLGPQFLEHLSAEASGTIAGAVARSFGFVSELSESDAELTARLSDLTSRFQRSPAAAIASLKWLQRRTARPSHPSGSAADSTSASSTDAARGTKRSAECWTPTPVKRMKVARESEEGFHQRCAIVASALQGSRDHGLPAATCKLLGEVISSSTSQAPEKRSDLEKSLVDMVGTALSGIEARLQQLVTESAAMLEDAEVERVIRDGLLLKEESKLVATRQRAVELKAAVTSNNDALREAMQSLSTAVEEQESGDTRYKELSEEKLKLEALERDVYEPTKNGAFPKAKANKNAKDLMLMGKKYSFDESLLVGLPGALTKKPDDRSTFDTMVLNAFESQIMTKIAEAEQSMMVEMPGREARATVVQSARSAHEAVKERHTTTHTELTAAQVLLREGEGRVRDAQRLVQSFGHEVQRLVTAKEHSELRVTAFREGPLAAFEELHKGSVGSHAVIVPEGAASTTKDSSAEAQAAPDGVTAPAVEPVSEAVDEATDEEGDKKIEEPVAEAVEEAADEEVEEGDKDEKEEEEEDTDEKKEAGQEAEEEVDDPMDLDSKDEAEAEGVHDEKEEKEDEEENEEDDKAFG